jgi:hypothetical protein
MAKIVRYEFMGSWMLFWLLGISILGIPLAILYLMNGTIRIEDKLDDPEQFVADFRSGKLAGK